MIFIFCYGRILVTIRRQARVMAAHSGQGSNTAQDHQSNKIQSSVIKTMILVCGLFAVTYVPSYIYTLLHIFESEITVNVNGWMVTMFIAYSYLCINPFIYAIKFDPVKRVLLGLIPCMNDIQHDPQSGGSYT